MPWKSLLFMFLFYFFLFAAFLSGGWWMSYGRSDGERPQVKAALRYKKLCDVTVQPQFLFKVILALFPPTHAPNCSSAQSGTQSRNIFLFGKNIIKKKNKQTLKTRALNSAELFSVCRGVSECTTI